MITVKCSTCGGVISGGLNSSTDHWCICAPYVPKGWECPKCGRVLNPNHETCPYCYVSKNQHYKQ